MTARSPKEHTCVPTAANPLAARRERLKPVASGLVWPLRGAGCLLLEVPVKLRVFAIAATCVLTASVLLPATVDAQGRRAVRQRPGAAVGVRPRPSVAVRPRAVVVRSRPTIVVRPRTSLVLGSYAYRPAVYSAGFYSSYYGPSYYAYGSRYYGYPSSYYAYSQWPPYGYGRGYDLSGSLRLQVSPRETEVFIDGYYAGTVDDFDGIFQRLQVEAGDHDLELYLAGHRSLQRKVYLQPGRTFNIRHAMEPIGPGEAIPLRPNGAPLSSAGPGPGAGPRQAPGRPRDRAGNPDADFGTLALRVQPGDAEVTIDGERWDGSADDDRLVVQLGVGVHRLEIRKDGYRAYFTDITVRGGETAALNVAMTPAR